MLRTFKIALFSATMLVAACKKSDKPAETKPADTTKAGDPSKPADPAAKPDPAKPADPAAKPAEPAAATGTNSELETKGIAMMQKMADVFAADEKDCEKLATDIKAFAAENKALFTELTAMEKKQSEQEKAAFEARNKGVQEAVMKKMGPTMTACGSNANVQAAMKEFPAD
jgi:hypothetical protein